jgi:hypothetical protein
MKLSKHFKRSTIAATLTATALLSLPSYAAENINLRFTGGNIGRDIFNPSVPGHYGIANLTYSIADKAKDNNGNEIAQPITVAGQTQRLRVDFKQVQTTLLLRYLYVADTEVLGAKINSTVALPLILDKKREVTLGRPVFTGSTPPLPARNAILQNLAAQEALQNTSTSGLGDMEVGSSLSWDSENSKLSAGLSLGLPTGKYDKTDVLTPGQGKFYTIRPSVSYGYVFENGIQLGGRVLWLQHKKYCHQLQIRRFLCSGSCRFQAGKRS